MKKLITTTAAALLLATTAYAANQKPADSNMGMMDGDMMKQCQSHMKDGKMMDNMPKDMMEKCHGMMKNMKPSDAVKSDTSKAAGDAEHDKHHPAQ